MSAGTPVRSVHPPTEELYQPHAMLNGVVMPVFLFVISDNSLFLNESMYMSFSTTVSSSRRRLAPVVVGLASTAFLADLDSAAASYTRCPMAGTEIENTST